MRPHLFILAISLCCPLPGGEKEKFKQPELIIDERFTIELVAAPPLVKHPMLGGFDSQGRLYVCESVGENMNREQLLEKLPNFVHILEDTDGNPPPPGA